MVRVNVQTRPARLPICELRTAAEALTGFLVPERGARVHLLAGLADLACRCHRGLCRTRSHAALSVRVPERALPTGLRLARHARGLPTVLQLSSDWGLWRAGCPALHPVAVPARRLNRADSAYLPFPEWVFTVVIVTAVIAL